MPPPAPAPPSLSQSAAEVKIPRPAPMPRGEYNLGAVVQDKNGSVYKLSGSAWLEDSRMLFRADEIEYDEESHEVRAHGHAYFYQFERNEQIWADRIEYNTEDEEGKFFEVRGETVPRTMTRPGILTSNSPFFFQGKWAERMGGRYILHQGFVTDCHVPKPWWILRGPKFVIVPHEHATAYRSIFWLRKFPLFYAPFFYKSLEKEPRKSGFLAPNLGHSSQRGFFFAVGYYWAYSRSHDLTYRMEDFTSRGYMHHVDLRGKPREGTDYNAIIYGMQDRGREEGGTLQKYSGLSLYAIGRTDLGDGWTGRAQINYFSSLRFRQAFTESYSELIGSEVHSVGFVGKDWSTFTFDAAAAHLQNSQPELHTSAGTATVPQNWASDNVVIRKLPEAEWSSRDHQIWQDIPLWYSLDSSAGLMSRSEPFFQQDPNYNYSVFDRYETKDFTERLRFAPRLASAFHWGGFSFIPSFGVDEAFYGESQTPYTDSAHLALGDRFQLVGSNLLRSARDFSAELIFPSLERIFVKKTVFGDKLKHVIEPRVTYRFVDGIGTDFTRIVRFDENDLLSDTNELELSVTNRIFSKRGDQVQELLTWEVSQKRYFDPTFGGALMAGSRNVVLSSAGLTGYAFLDGPRSSSPIVSVLRLDPVGGVSLDWRADYDHRRGELINSAFAMSYGYKQFRVLAGHNKVHTDPVLTAPANQFNVSALYGSATHRGWNAGINSTYDYRKATLLQTILQVTYNTDCCGLSVQYRRFNVNQAQTGTDIRVAFSIANIGTFGTLKKQEQWF